MRSISSRAAAAALTAFALLGPCAASAASEESGLEAGRSAGRALLILRDPRACGIALIRRRCMADVDRFLAGKTDADFSKIPKIGPHPATGLRSFVTAGDRDAFDAELGYINSRRSTPAMWSADARGAALFDAGIEDVGLPAAQSNPLAELFAVEPIADLANHAAQIPAATLPIDIAPLRSDAPSAGSHRLASGAMKFAHALVAALDAAMPPPPLAKIRYVDGAAGDAALGVASATVSELVDSPSWLAQADAQRFFDGYTARLAIVAPSRRADVATLRAALRGGASFSHGAALKANEAVVGAILRSDAARAKPIVLGALAAQMVYNAAILRDPRMGNAAVHVLGTETGLDAAVPGWSAARDTAGGITADDWSAQYQVGLHLIALITGAQPT